MAMPAYMLKRGDETAYFYPTLEMYIHSSHGFNTKVELPLQALRRHYRSLLDQGWELTKSN